MCELTANFTVPVSAVITGPLSGGGIRHFCLALRGWNGHHTVRVHEEVDGIDCEELECVLSEVCYCQYSPLLSASNTLQQATENILDPSESFDTQARRLLREIEATSAARASASNGLFSPALFDVTTPFNPSPPLSPLELPPFQSEGDYRASASAWEHLIQAQIESARSGFTPSETRITISSDSANNAARAFLDLCMSWSESPEAFSVHDGDEHVTLPPGTSLRNCNPTTVNFGRVNVAM